MALRNITQALKAVTGNLDATKLATFERDILAFLPSATKKEFLDVSLQIAEADAFTKPVWDLVQTQYLQRYDEFTGEDTLVFYDVVSSCPLDVYRELDEKLWNSLVYLGKKESEKYAKADPAFEEKMDTVFQGLFAQSLGTVIPMIKDGDDIFTDTTSKVEILTRERKPEDIENKFAEILGIEDVQLENYNPALQKLWSGKAEDEDEQIALWESLLNQSEPTTVVVSKGEEPQKIPHEESRKVPGEESGKIPGSAPAKKK